MSNEIPHGERIRHEMVWARREAGITSQAEMAQLMGVSVGYVQRLESPDGKTWERISLYWAAIEGKERKS